MSLSLRCRRAAPAQQSRRAASDLRYSRTPNVLLHTQPTLARRRTGSDERPFDFRARPTQSRLEQLASSAAAATAARLWDAAKRRASAGGTLGPRPTFAEVTVPHAAGKVGRRKVNAGKRAAAAVARAVAAAGARSSSWCRSVAGGGCNVVLIRGTGTHRHPPLTHSHVCNSHVRPACPTIAPPQRVLLVLPSFGHATPGPVPPRRIHSHRTRRRERGRAQRRG